MSDSLEDREEMPRGNVGKVYLSKGFKPSNIDILCSKGKRYYDSPGNYHFRQTIFQILPTYMKAQTKLEKSTIVNEILQIFRSQDAGFIRQDPDGRYYEIGDDAAREKIGQTIRDSLIRQDPEKQVKKRQRRALNKAKRTAAARTTVSGGGGGGSPIVSHPSPTTTRLLPLPTHVMVEYDPTGRPREVRGTYPYPTHILAAAPHHHLHNRKTDKGGGDQKVAALALLGIAQGVTPEPV